MTTQQPNGPAPGFSRYNIGRQDGKVARAWQYAWDQMSRTEWSGGRELAERAAARFGLKAVSLMTHFSRMAAEGVLEVKRQPLPQQAARRVRLKDGTERISHYTTHQPTAFYRIKSDD